MTRLPEHNPFFDPHIEEAHNFTTTQLGLTVTSLENVSVIDPQHAQAVKEQLGIPPNEVGNFDIPTGRVVLFPKADNENPAGATIRTGSNAVHELVHSGTANPHEHLFYNEAAAGMGEAKYLQWLQAKGRWVPAADYVLNRAGVSLWLPGTFRYYNSSPGAVKQGNSSQALVASIGVGLGMYKSGIKTADVMTASSLGGRGHIAIMKRALDSLEPGLATRVEDYPQNTDGIIQATALVQSIARKRGLIK